MIANHLAPYGVPWPEASADSFPYNANVMAEWDSRKSRTKPGHRVYLALNPVSQTRDGLALLWSANGNRQPLPAPWNNFAVNHSQVKQAYLNYTRRAIAYFSPDYVTVGVEVNQVMARDPALWAAYLDLHKTIYGSLKSMYPSLPIMVSLDANDLLGYSGANASDQMRARAEIADYSDYFCLSLYLYLGSNTGGSFPGNAFDRLAAMTTKPIAVCETGYPSQGFTLRTPGAPIVRSDPKVQETFIDRLFQAADKYSYRFIVHFFLRDFDPSLDFSDIIRTFRYDGLYDVNGAEKPAFGKWKQKLKLKLVVPTLTESRMQPHLDPSTPSVPTSSSEADESVYEVAGNGKSTREATVVYTNDNRNGSNTVSALAMAPSGSLIPITGSPFQTGGTGTGSWRVGVNDVVVTPAGFLYAANNQSGDISAFSIDPTTGRLALVQKIPFSTSDSTGGEFTLAVSPAGDVLVAGNSVSQNMAVFNIASNGSLVQRLPAVPLGAPPTTLKLSPNGRFLAVTLAHDGRIPVFRIESGGSLVPVSGSPFFGRFGNATSVDFACTGGLLYAVNGGIGSRAVSTLDIFRMANSGALEPVPDSPFHSNTGMDGNTLLLSPDDRFVYVTNQGLRNVGGGAIAVFRVMNDSVSLVSGSPFQIGSDATPMGMATTHSGKFLLTADYPNTRYATPSIGVFVVGPDGVLSRAPGSPFTIPGSSLTSVATFPPALCSSAVTRSR